MTTKTQQVKIPKIPKNNLRKQYLTDDGIKENTQINAIKTDRNQPTHSEFIFHIASEKKSFHEYEVISPQSFALSS
ncbi:TPA: hypothetical protein ACN3ZQ_002181 [Vibrio cholerae]